MIIGNKDNFAIEYNFIKHPYGDESGLLKDSWGELKIWLKNKNILQYLPNKFNMKTYEWNLCYILEWFSENLTNIEFSANFLYGIHIKDSVDFLKKMRQFEPDFDSDEFMKWHEVVYKFSAEHCLRSAYDGSPLPELYFRKQDSYVEICWDNTGLYDDRKLYFRFNEGRDYIDFNIFKRVISDFIDSFIGQFEDKYPEQMNQLRNYKVANSKE